MINKIKRYLRKAILGYDISTYFFSHSGEDAILQAIFRQKLDKKEKGFFIDIGAYHPYEASNTYLFYINGWTGINIDACPGSMKAFNKIRPKDINLEMGIGEKEDILTYYFIDGHSSMNSFSKENLLQIGMWEHVKKEIPIKVLPLSHVLSKYSGEFNTIDLLNIDVEGFDLEVIKSNDWSKYKPKVIVIELYCKNIRDLETNETAIFLCNIGYEIVGKNVILRNLASVIFVDSSFEY